MAAAANIAKRATNARELMKAAKDAKAEDNAKAAESSKDNETSDALQHALAASLSKRMLLDHCLRRLVRDDGTVAPLPCCDEEEEPEFMPDLTGLVPTR